MIDRLGVHGANDAEIIRHLWGMLEYFAYLLPGFAMTVELKIWSPTGELFPLELGDGLALCQGIRHGFPIQFGELGLGVKGFKVGWATGHVQEDDALDPGSVMTGQGDTIPARYRLVASHQVREGDAPESGGCLIYKGASCEHLGVRDSV